MSGPQLTRGGRQVLDWLDAEIADADHDLEIAQARAIANPHYAIDLINKARNVLARVQREYPDKMRPFLERQSPQYEQRLADVEEQIEALREIGERVKVLEEIAEIADDEPKVTQFPRRDTGTGK
jgi:archaellum component FlaC